MGEARHARRPSVCSSSFLDCFRPASPPRDSNATRAVRTCDERGHRRRRGALASGQRPVCTTRENEREGCGGSANVSQGTGGSTRDSEREPRTGVRVRRQNCAEVRVLDDERVGQLRLRLKRRARRRSAAPRGAPRRYLHTRPRGAARTLASPAHPLPPHPPRPPPPRPRPPCTTRRRPSSSASAWQRLRRGLCARSAAPRHPAARRRRL